MNDFLNLHLKKLGNHFDYPELELRVLLNRSSIIDKKFFLVILRSSLNRIIMKI